MRYSFGNKHWRLVLVLGAALMMLWPAGAQPAAAVRRLQGSVLAVSDLKSDNCPNFQAILRYTDDHAVFINNLLNTDLKVTAGNATGASLPVQFARVDTPPLAVAIVADLSARTRQVGLLNRPRFKDMADIIGDLGPKLNNSRSTFSLVTLTDTVETVVSQQADFRYVTNALTNLESKVPPEGASEQYPLTQAIQQALAELAAAPDTSNRLLFVYAAGDPASDPRAALQPTLVQMQSNPPAMTFIGLAGDLKPSASALRADYYPFFAETLADLNTLRANIDKRYRETTLLSGYYSVVFDASALPPGSQTVMFSASGASASVPLQMCTLPPQITLQSPQQIDQSRFRLSITAQFTQTALVNVTYYLDQQELGSADARSNFALEFDPADPQYRERNYTGDRDYQLTAVASDSSGQRSAETQAQLFRLPQQRPSSLLWALVAGAIVFVALVAFVAVRYIRSRGRDGSGEQPDQTQPPDGTLSPDTQPPLPIPNTHRYFQPLVVTVTDRQAGETYNYPLDNPTVANYGIGTSTGNPIRITRAAPGVSRNHATLTPVKQGWELTDRSTYGTFLGDTPTEEHKIATNEAVAVQPGAQIWIGREIVLTLKSLQAPPPGGDTTITRTLGDETLPPKESFQSPYMTRNLQRNPHSKALRVIVLDTDTNETYPYELDSATVAGYDIGIGQQNAIQIRRNVQGVSRNHARLVPMPDGWKLSDTGGHGTYLGASPDESNLIGRQPVPVQAGATIWIGKDIKLTLEHIQ